MSMGSRKMRPNNVNQMKVCIHAVYGGDFSGELLNPYTAAPIPFSNLAALLGEMDRVMDRLGFPQPFVEHRTFRGAGRPRHQDNEGSLTRFMDELTFESKAGQRATFIIQIQFRQNSTWQGTITWSEEKKTKHFRSTLEMLKLMDDAMEEADYAEW